MAGKPSAHEFVRFLVGSIVDQPDALRLYTSRDGRHDLVEVRVAPGDLPNVIGRGGKTAQSLRAVLDAWTYKHRLRAHLRILEEDEAPKGDPVDGDGSDDSDDAYDSDDEYDDDEYDDDEYEDEADDEEE